MEVICRRRETCSFRVHSDYFRQKTRFTVNSCPVDGGPLGIVLDGTDTFQNGYRLETDEHAQGYRTIVEVAA